MYYSYFYKVENKKAYRTANDHYWLAKTEDNKIYLFTDSDLDKASSRAFSNPEDIPSEFFTHKKDRPHIRFIFGLFFGLLISGITWFLLK